MKTATPKPAFKPDDFSPEVWQTSHDGKPVNLLVCAKRWIHTPFTENAQGGKVCQRLTHPVAIVLGAPSIAVCDVSDTEHDWRVGTPEEHGIRRRLAQAALAEAWRGVEGISCVGWPANQFKFDFKAPCLIPRDTGAAPQEATALRNLNAWLCWARWEKQNLSPEARAAELSAMGIPCTRKQLTKAAENAGF
jgi:hypothetical protein